MKKEPVLQTSSVDLTLFIRSIQRLEGYPDCFRTANDYCDRMDCVWRVYCLEKLQDDPVERKEISDEEDRDFVR